MNSYFFEKLVDIRQDHICMDDWNEAVFGALRTLRQAVDAQEKELSSLRTTVRCAHVQPEPIKHGCRGYDQHTGTTCECGQQFFGLNETCKIGYAESMRAWARHMDKAGAL